LKKYFCFLLFFIPSSFVAQEEISYRFDTFGSLSSGNFTPSWMAGNTYGVVSLKPDNAYLRGDIAWKHSLGKEVILSAEADLVTAARHTSSFWIQQLYADISYRKIHLTLGLKEQYYSMLDKDLSQGDFTYSNNARPFPKIELNLSDYLNVPFTNGILAFKTHFSVGKFIDKNYILRTKNENVMYTYDVLWHHKSLFLKLEDSNGKFPFSLILGVDDGAQWGGWTSYEGFGKLPDSFKDFVSIVIGKSGDTRAIKGDQINILGNHLGTMNLKVDYKTHAFRASVYKQHFYEDASGLEFANWRDGIWGGEISFHNCSFLKKALVEFTQTTNQSGPLHFLFYDSRFHPRGGGNDDYYNHDYYVSGWSYLGRALGNPLMASPEYNGDGTLDFKNNRLKSFHLGFEGQLNDQISYRTLFTGMYAWGRMQYPFPERKHNFSSLIECNYKPKRFEGWQIGAQLAFDKGNLYGDNFGCSLKISKFGFIRF
jgi:hypothetical protein